MFEHSGIFLLNYLPISPVEIPAVARANCFRESMAVQYCRTEKEMDMEPNYRYQCPVLFLTVYLENLRSDLYSASLPGIVPFSSYFALAETGQIHFYFTQAWSGFMAREER